MDHFDKDVVYINSYDRLSGTSSSFTADVSQQVKPVNDYDSIVLLNASIPKSYYLVNNYSNTFQISESGYPTRTITLVNGNYSLTALRSALNTLIAAAGLQFTYVFSISQITGKSTFTSSGTGCALIFGANSPWRILGFNKATYNIPLVGSAYTVTSPNVVNLQLTNTIDIMSNVVDKGILSSVIPSQSDFGAILFIERNAGLVSKQLISRQFNSIQIYLLDGITGQPIDLNGLDVQMTLVLYKKNNYFKTMLEDHKLQLLQDDYEQRARAADQPQ